MGPYGANIVREMDGKGRVDLSGLDSLREDIDGQGNAESFHTVIVINICPAGLMAVLQRFLCT